MLQAGALWTFLRQAMQLKYDLDIGLPRPPLGATEQPWPQDDVRRLLALVDGPT